jgi:HD-GYP domain-containing protein (c-di-GMP phosphodiesterase class II)
MSSEPRVAAPGTPHSSPRPSAAMVANVNECLSVVETWIAALRVDAKNRSVAEGLRQLAFSLREESKKAGCRPVMPLLSAMVKLAEKLRDGELAFDAAVGELIMLSFDRVKLAVTALSEGRDQATLQIDEAAQTLGLFANAAPDERGEHAERAVALLTGAGIWKEAAIQNNLIADLVLDTLWAPLNNDLTFFRGLCRTFEQRLPFAHGRSERMNSLAAQMNAEAGTPIDPHQLEAAIYMHDLGMSFLPEGVLAKPGRLSEEEWALLRGHTEHGAGLLSRMPAWAEAAQMVEQHHERPDGKGYPRGLTGEAIVPGAKLIALLDAFEAMTHQRADRPYRRSVLGAMAEINACEQQFAREWVPIANRVVRRLLSGTDPAGGGSLVNAA